MTFTFDIPQRKLRRSVKWTSDVESVIFGSYICGSVSRKRSRYFNSGTTSMLPLNWHLEKVTACASERHVYCLSFDVFALSASATERPFIYIWSVWSACSRRSRCPSGGNTGSGKHSLVVFLAFHIQAKPVYYIHWTWLQSSLSVGLCMYAYVTHT